MLDATKLYQKMIEAGQDWADKDAAANLLEETRKSVLAQIMSSLVGSYPSRVALEGAALKTDEYTRHIEQMVGARREANRARAQYDAIKTYIELVRTNESTLRAEMNLAR